MVYGEGATSDQVGPISVQKKTLSMAGSLFVSKIYMVDPHTWFTMDTLARSLSFACRMGSG